VIVLQVRLQPSSAAAASEIRRVFAERFAPAVRTQLGFRSALLMEAADDAVAAGDRAAESGEVEPIFMELRFDDEVQRLAWVATPEHGRIWPMVQALCDGISRVRYDVVEGPVEPPVR
jgi:hypothetical protein